MAKQLAIIKNISYGLRDIGQPCLSFDTYLSEGLVALQVLFGKDIEKLLKDGQIIDIKELEGHACWVEKEGNVIKFLRIANI